MKGRRKRDEDKDVDKDYQGPSCPLHFRSRSLKGRLLFKMCALLQRHSPGRLGRLVVVIKKRRGAEKRIPERFISPEKRPQEMGWAFSALTLMILLEIIERQSVSLRGSKTGGAGVHHL